MISLFILLIFFLILPNSYAQPLELIFWHGMAGHLGEEVQALADDFNRSQYEYHVKPVYKGHYVEILTSFAAAFRAHQPPNMVQIFEVGTAMMLSPHGVIKSVEEIMNEQGMSLPKQDFIQSVREFYSENDRLMAMPFNLSAPILYYNKDALAKAGYNESNFPKTWDEMEVLAKQLKNEGYDCTYTTAYPGWILFESYLAIHGLPLLADHPLRAVYDSPHLVRHFERLKRWHQSHYFKYGGRVDDSTILFTSQICPLFSQSSGAYNSLLSLVPFKLGVATMPLDTQTSPVRHANVTGGAAIWAVGGQSAAQYRGIALFFSFLASPNTQKRWHEHTGYLPIGFKGIYKTILKNSQNPSLLMMLNDLEEPIISQKTTARPMGPQNQIRNINDEAFELMFTGLTDAQQAVHESVIRANHILLRFARNTKGLP